CRWAPVTISDSGTPRASTRTCRLLPFFPPVCRVRTGCFSGQRRFDRAPVDALPFPGDPLRLIILGETGAPESEEEACFQPLSKVLVDRARAPESLLGERLPLAPCPQDEDDT